MAYRLYDPQYNPELAEYRRQMEENSPYSPGTGGGIPEGYSTPPQFESPELRIRRLREAAQSSPDTDKFRQLIESMPQREKPSLLRRIGATFAGATVGAGHGPEAGYGIGSAIAEAPYRNKMQDWLQKVKAQEALLQEERAGRAGDISGANAYTNWINTLSKYDPALTENLAAAKARGNVKVTAPVKEAEFKREQEGRKEITGMQQEGATGRTQMQNVSREKVAGISQEGANLRNQRSILSAQEIAAKNREAANARAAARNALSRELAAKGGIGIGAEEAARKYAEQLTRRAVDPETGEEKYADLFDDEGKMLSPEEVSTKGFWNIGILNGPDKVAKAKKLRQEYFNEVFDTVDDLVKSSRGR